MTRVVRPIINHTFITQLLRIESAWPAAHSYYSPTISILVSRSSRSCVPPQSVISCLPSTPFQTRSKGKNKIEDCTILARVDRGCMYMDRRKEGGRGMCNSKDRVKMRLNEENRIRIKCVSIDEVDR